MNGTVMVDELRSGSRKSLPRVRKDLMALNMKSQRPALSPAECSRSS